MNPYLPPLDVGMGYAVIVFGILGLVGLAAAILLEALVLRRLQWGGLGRSLLDSFLMNVASAAIGIILTLMLRDATLPYSSVGSVIVCLPVLWAFSVLVEAGALALIRKKGFRAVVRPVLLANLASYILIATVVLIQAVLT